MTNQDIKVIIIRRDNIGDLVCTTPMIHALRERHPSARIAVLANSYNFQVLERNPDIDDIFFYTKAKHRGAAGLVSVYWQRFRLLRRLRRQRYDYALLPGSDASGLALKLAREIRPRHIVGFVSGRGPAERHIDMAVPLERRRPLHEAEDAFRLLAPLGIEGAPGALRIHPDPARVAAVRRAASSTLGPACDNLIGLHIGARKPSNRWPAERFAELAERLHARHGARLLLMWAPGDARSAAHPGDDALAAGLIERMRGLPVLGYRTTELADLVAALSLCRVVICSDGGAMHIAAALGKPILCFFGDSDRARWHPWGVPHVLLQPESRDAADVTVAQAEQAFEDLLRAGETPAGKPG